MIRFAAMIAALEREAASGAKIALLADYFSTAPQQDRLWAIALFSGRRPKRMTTTGELRAWAIEIAEIPDWLFEESYAVAGDLAETIAHILPPPQAGDAPIPSLEGAIRALIALTGAPLAARKAMVRQAWAEWPLSVRFVFNKLLTGGWRIGVSQGLLTRALAQVTARPQGEIAHRLMGDWSPDTITWDGLLGDAGAAKDDPTRPYPFQLAHAWSPPDAAHFDPDAWSVEYKWDGIRGQMICRAGGFHLWTRGAEMVTTRFPELAPLAPLLAQGLVLDGEIIAWDHAHARPLPFAQLQRRVGRLKPSARMVSDCPVIFLAYDLLEEGGIDLRDSALAARRARLSAILADLPDTAPMRLSQTLRVQTLSDLTAAHAQARKVGAEGVMIKSRNAPYLAGRARAGGWFKWKSDPMTIDAVMIYAQAGHGRRANLYSDFTFALWQEGRLLPIAKAYSGLTDAELSEITRWVRANSIDRFGPVRAVKAELVFELAFEGLGLSTRHKSGYALRFPRILRWRRDKPAAEANEIADLAALMEGRREQG